MGFGTPTAALLRWRIAVAVVEGRGVKTSCARRRFSASSFVGYRFPPEVIVLAVRWYLRYGLSYRDVEELLAERGVEVDHVTIYRWVQRFTPLLIDAARPCRHGVGGRWFVDETYVKVGGVWRYVYRAVDQHGQVIDIYVSRRRNTAAARRFFKSVLGDHGLWVPNIVSWLRRRFVWSRWWSCDAVRAVLCWVGGCARRWP
jgi:transposase-like protein